MNVPLRSYEDTQSVFDVIKKEFFSMIDSEIYEIVMIQPRSVKADPYTLSLLKIKTQADYDKFLETHEYVSEKTLESGYVLKTYQEKN